MAEEERERLELEEQQKRAELQKEASQNLYIVCIQIAETDGTNHQVIDFVSNYSERRQKQRLRRTQRSSDRRESVSCSRTSKSAWRGRR